MINTPQKEASEKAFALKQDSPRVLASDKTVARMIDGSRATVWRRVNDGTLPRPIKFGGMTRWSLAEIEAVIAAKLAERDEPEAA